MCRGIAQGKTATAALQWPGAVAAHEVCQQSRSPTAHELLSCQLLSQHFLQNNMQGVTSVLRAHHLKGARYKKNLSRLFSPKEQVANP
jgi:hypothetical protein